MRRAALLLVTALVLGGCVERRLVIRTDPPGAAVALDGRSLPQPAPVVVEPSHHGLRLVEATLAGHRPAAAVVRTEGAWYDRFPLDLLAELWPATLRSETTVELRLAPRSGEGPPETELDRLEARAVALRRKVAGRR